MRVKRNSYSWQWDRYLVLQNVFLVLNKKKPMQIAHETAQCEIYQVSAVITALCNTPPFAISSGMVIIFMSMGMVHVIIS